MKSDAADKHSSLVVRGIGGEKKSFKRTSTFGASSLSHKYQTWMKSNATDKHSSLVICGIGGEEKSFKRFSEALKEQVLRVLPALATNIRLG